MRPIAPFLMSRAGLEPTTYGLKVPEGRDMSSVFCEAPCERDLGRLIDAWPHFSEAKRAAILALVDAPIG